MKALALGLVIASVVALLAVATVNRRALWRAPAECHGRLVIVRPLRGEPLECVCDAGVFFACFSPGP